MPDISGGQRRREHTGQAAETAEDIGPWRSAAGAPPVFIAGSAGAQTQPSGQRILKKPWAASPGGMHFDEPFQFGVVPVEDRPAPADMGYQQVGLRILLVGGVELRDRPRLRDGCATGHSLMPLQGTGDGGVLAEENDIVVASDARGAAPFDTGIAHESAVMRGVA